MQHQETMNQIHHLANERLNLYREAGRHSLSSAQMQRVHEINGELPMMWDQYRREYAARNRSADPITVREAA